MPLPSAPVDPAFLSGQWWSTVALDGSAGALLGGALGAWVVVRAIRSDERRWRADRRDRDADDRLRRVQEFQRELGEVYRFIARERHHIGGRESGTELLRVLQTELTLVQLRAAAVGTEQEAAVAHLVHQIEGLLTHGMIRPAGSLNALLVMLESSVADLLSESLELGLTPSASTPDSAGPQGGLRARLRRARDGLRLVRDAFRRTPR